MKNAIKTGFGIAIGYGLAQASVVCLKTFIAKKLANDVDFMKFEETNNPEMYEELKKYYE